MMRRILALSLLLAGCSRVPTFTESVNAYDKALRAKVVTGNLSADGWSVSVDAREAFCRSQNLPDTEEARADCMGRFGKGETIEEDLATIAAGFDHAVEPLEEMRAAAKRIDAFIEGDEP